MCIHDIIPVKSKQKSHNTARNLLESGGQTH
jgi:hypothetical protein